MNNCNSEIPLISFINVGRSLSTFEEKDDVKDVKDVKITDHGKKMLKQIQICHKREEDVRIGHNISTIQPV